MKFTNNSGGPRIINTTDGPVQLAAGATSADLDVNPAERAAIERYRLLDPPGSPQGQQFDITTLQANPADNPNPGGAGGEGGGEGAGGGEGGNGTDKPLTAEQAAEVARLVDANTKPQLLELAGTTEGVTATDDNNKAEIAEKIVRARSA
jgi:hypothetical protein